MANVGPAVVRYLDLIGITEPSDLVGRDPVEMYELVNAAEGRRLDPCLLDTFMSVVDQASGGSARPWWSYTAERKRLLAVAPPTTSTVPRRQ